MAPQDKQERRLARQRGAGPRELKNAAFNFSFGAPPVLQPQPSSRKTPKSRKATPQKTQAAGPSTGKRKRETPTARPSTSSSAKQASTPLQLGPPDEIDELSPDLPVPIDVSDLPQARRVSIPILPLNKPLEPRPPPSPDRRPPREERGRSRTRKSVVSVSYSLSRSRLDALEEEGDEDEDEFMSGAQTRETDPVTEITQATPSTRRASMPAGSTGRKTSGAGTFDGGTSTFLRNQAVQSTRREVFETPEHETQIDDELTPESMRVSRKEHSEIDILADADAMEIIEDEDEDELSPQQDTSINDSLTSIRTPLADRSTNTILPQSEQAKPRREETAEPLRKKQKTASTKPAKSTYKGGPTIPITIYRRTKLADDDPLGIDPDPVPSMNASDVLSQISSEIINAYISNVPAAAQRATGSQSKSSTKKTLRHQMQALQQFRDNLTDALRTITFAQHSFYKFGGEVRRAKKQKRELREELIARRKEREALEIEIDRVRGEHLAAEGLDEKKRRLVDDVESIEAAVRRGREKATGDEDPEAGVLARAEEIRDRLGVLDRVREFNDFLARTAEVL